MANSRKDLKAYVRFDGSGRVVPSSLILRRSMPKVGNWKQISAYECCDPDFPTTTTTTAIPVSDFRLKTNIVATGNMIGELKEYTWEWNDLAKYIGIDGNPTKGVMAQEALEMYPQHVHFDEKIGYFRVDLNAITKQTKNG
jgi:hypothetical protein